MQYKYTDIANVGMVVVVLVGEGGLKEGIIMKMLIIGGDGALRGPQSAFAFRGLNKKNPFFPVFLSGR